MISLSGLQIVDWVAAKEYNHEKRPLLHLYVEIEAQSLASIALSKEILREHLSVYFKYVGLLLLISVSQEKHYEK